MVLSSRMRRAQRSARAIVGGQKILDHLLKDDNKRRLIEAANEGVPPVSRISATLVKVAEAGGIDLKAMSVRQFIGMIVRAILEDEGYSIAEKGVRLAHDPVFTSGSVYQKRSVAGDGKQGTILERLLASLTDFEAEQALAVLQDRVQNS